MTLRDDKRGKADEAAMIPPPESKRAKPVSNVRSVVEEFQLDMKMSIVQRAAHFFDYLAKKAPYQACPPNLAYKAVMGFGKLPREVSDDVLKFRKRSSSIREALGREYGRGLVVEPPLGLMRATVDDDDLAMTQQLREVHRIRSSVNAAKRTNALIKSSQVRDPAVRAWLKGGVSPLLKALTDDDRIFRLMPAKPRDDDGGES